jgi:hypothetical protein
MRPAPLTGPGSRWAVTRSTDRHANRFTRRSSGVTNLGPELPTDIRTRSRWPLGLRGAKSVLLGPLQIRALPVRKAGTRDHGAIASPLHRPHVIA